MDLSAKVSKYFTWQEVLWLPSWRRCATEEDGLTEEIKANLAELCDRVDAIRKYFGKPIIVHSGFRPVAYNATIPGSAKKSMHTLGKALDFHVNGVNCDTARKRILDADLLELCELRMENLPGSGWIHLDIKPVKEGGVRFFKP